MIEQIRRSFEYSPVTGLLTWTYRTDGGAGASRHNKMLAGKPAFAAKCRNGYLKGGFRGKTLLAHRVVWAWVYGEWPSLIDHINGDRSDNRVSNLRNVSAKINQRNSKRDKRNTSGHVGVSFVEARQKWQANLGRKTLGRYNCLTAAVVARAIAQQGKGFTERHGT